MLVFQQPIDQIMMAICNSVSQRVLPQVQQANSAIQCINFMFGHQIEVKNLLQVNANDPILKYKRFPLIFLQADVKSDPPSVKGLYCDLTLQIFILIPTDPTYVAAKRLATNFVPILRPIYQTLIQEIWRSGYFWVQSSRQLLGRDQEHLFWGKEEGQGGIGKNYFNEYIDCIEIKNLKLTLCRAGNNIPQNSFTQFVQFYLMETRAVITIGEVTNNTISNSFFSTAITQIVTDDQAYIVGVNFNQNITNGTITGIDITFETSQVIIAIR